ncbi:MAG TPA: septum formation initiator family protein [Desulfuromonadaceae bacterium]|nr:septum formation initiator family protein [Desulfuromonadaceae bacterium]
MNVDLGIWSKLTKIVIALIVLAVLILFAMKDFPLIQQNERMRSEILRLNQQLELEKEKSKQLQTQMDVLTHDPKTVERLAREKLGYARADETIVRFEPIPTNNPAR